MAHHGKNMIGGELSAAGTQKFRALNPATGGKLEGDFVEATLAELDKALDLAARAFPVYRKLAPDQIAAFLERIGAEIVALGPALLERTGAETGLPAARLEGERARTVGQLKMSPIWSAKAPGWTRASTVRSPTAHRFRSRTCGAC